MADNKTIPDASGVAFTVRTKDNAAVNLPVHTIGDSAGVNLSAVDVNGRVQVSLEGSRATYHYCLSAFAMVAAPTDAFIIQGSATKTLRVKKIKLSGQATAQGSMPVQLIKRTAADTTNGVLTGIVPAKHDTNDAAATGVVSSVGTANFTSLGASAGVAGVGRLGFSALSTGTAGFGQELHWDFALNNDKPFILRGVAEFLVVNFAGAAIPAGGVVDIEIETEEDAS